MEGNLTKGPILKTLTKLAIPIMASSFLGTLYNITDMAWIGRLGSKAVAGVGVGGMYIWLSQGLASMARMGGQVQVAQCIGRGDREAARGYAQTAVQLATVLGLAFSAICVIFLHPLVDFFKLTDPEALEAAFSYTLVACGLLVFSFLTLTLTGLYTAQGDSKTPFVANFIGLVTNMILDPVLILGPGPFPKLGAVGAAIATVIAQFVSFLWVVRFYRGPLALLRVRPRFLPPRGDLVRRIVILGSSPAFMISTEGILLLSFNTQLARFGGDIAVGAMAILASIFQLVLLPMIGIYQGAQPIVSFNYGSGDYGRVKETIWLAGKATLLYSLICTCLLVAFPRFFVSLFTPDQALVEQAAPMLRLYICGCFFLGMTIVSQDSYNALGDGKLSLFFAFFRKGMLLIPLIYILPGFAEDRVCAVIAAEPVSDIIASLASTVYFVHYVKKKLSPRPSSSEI